MQTDIDSILKQISGDYQDDEIQDQPIKDKKRKTVALKQMSKKTLYKRAHSETQLMDAVGTNFKDGDIYNCITSGDVDALSYLKVVLRQQSLEHCLISTWCMANHDVLQIEEWINEGKLNKVDFYVGEIFPGTYSHEYSELKRIITKDVGRVCVFKNHSKIFAGYGDKFAFGIQTSANINTNPRTENGCITIGQEIYEFYKLYFDGIVGFEKN
jgi:ribosomal protein L10